jgi:hypothetical protein
MFGVSPPQIQDKEISPAPGNFQVLGLPDGPEPLGPGGVLSGANRCTDRVHR